MVEVTVSLKGEDSTYKQKFLVYEEFKMQHDDPIILELIKETKQQCTMKIEDVKVRAVMQVE